MKWRVDEMEYLDEANLLTVLLALTGVCGVLAAIWKGVDAYRKLTGSQKKEEEQARMRHSLEALDNRVTVCETRFESAHGDMTQMLTVLNAMLMHFISGNDHDKLRGVKEGLDRYLSDR